MPTLRRTPRPPCGPRPRRAAGGRFALGYALLALAALHGALAGCRGGGPQTPPPDPLAGATVVGDEACGTCHEALYASYHRTGMGRSVSRFDPATAPERFGADGRSPVVCHDATGYCYQAFVRGDTLFQRETRPDEPGWARVYPASHVVGSGNATRSYFMTVGAPGDADGAGYVTEMPLTWYVERAVWDLSPGYAQTNPRFERPISLECMTCHNGAPGFSPGTPNHYTDVPLGITCERCHGPGSRHVEARQESEGDGGPDPTIVNPARLAPDLQLAVCQQCHLVGTEVPRPGEDPTTYRPGRPLPAHRAVFIPQEQLDDPAAFGISSHAERMMRSACFVATEGTARPMTCTTCHDPHRPTAEVAPDHFNQACRSCHTPAPGGAPGAGHTAVCTRPGVDVPAEALTGDCVSCHLRESGTSDIPHVTFTDHWIRRTLPPPSSTAVTAEGFIRDRPFRLVDVTAREAAQARRPAGGADAGADLARGLATFAFYDTKHRLPAYLPEVLRLLRAGLAGGADHPQARLTLGRALFDLDSLAAAEAALGEAVGHAPQDPLAHYWLGATRLARGDAAGAAAALAEAVRLQPRFVEARVKHAEALAAARRPAEALAALEGALRLDPVRHAGAWNNLGLARLEVGQLAPAQEALARAVALDPRLVEARTTLGGVLLAQGDAAGAARHLEAALRVSPSYGPALGNLGVAYLRLERRADARRQFERLLQLDPADRQAAAYLQQLR